MKKWITLFSLSILMCSTTFCQEEESTPEEIWDSYIYYLVDTLGQTLSNEDPSFINSIFDKEAFCQKIIIEKEDDEVLKAFNDGFLSGFKEELDFGKMMINAVDGKYYDFVNQYTSIEGKTHLIYRLLHADGAFNYHDYEMEWRDSTLQIVDMYIYVTGEKLSETFHQLYKNAFREEMKKRDSFFGRSNKSAPAEKLKEAEVLMKAGKAQEAMDLYMTIPQKYQEQKVYRIWKIKIAKELSPEIYIEAVSEYVEAFPNDPSFYLMAYDKAVADEDYDLAFKYIDKIDISIGLDPFLDFYRGNIYYYKGDYEKALEKYKIIEKDYSFITLDEMYFEVYLAMKNYDQVAIILDRFVVNYGLTKLKVAELIEKSYPDIFSNPKLKTWKEKEE